MRKESSSETESEQQQRDDEFEEISLPKKQNEIFSDGKLVLVFIIVVFSTVREVIRYTLHNADNFDVIIPRYFETLTAQHQDVALASASSQNRSNPKERLHAISITLPHRETPPAAVPLTPPPAVVMLSATSKLPNIQKATQYEV
uniref:Transmembrane protein n=1 Tax=Angiostrongylus cantonensis TaxID=6313 RepID=A0A0K0DQZ8_ANGCA